LPSVVIVLTLQDGRLGPLSVLIKVVDKKNIKSVPRIIKGSFQGQAKEETHRNRILGFRGKCRKNVKAY